LRTTTEFVQQTIIVAGPPVSTTHARWLYHKNGLPRALIRGEKSVACQFQQAKAEAY
jgi:hypothetical protein